MINQDNSLEKYLKYKTKYLELKEKLEGGYKCIRGSKCHGNPNGHSFTKNGDKIRCRYCKCVTI
jgi:hypothetical protein